MAVAVSCVSCNFPIAAHQEGEKIHCPFCGKEGEVYVPRGNQIGSRISSPGPGEFILGLVIGVIFAAPIFAVMKGGTSALARLAEKKLGR